MSSSIALYELSNKLTVPHTCHEHLLAKPNIVESVVFWMEQLFLPHQGGIIEQGWGKNHHSHDFEKCLPAAAAATSTPSGSASAIVLVSVV